MLKYLLLFMGGLLAMVTTQGGKQSGGSSADVSARLGAIADRKSRKSSTEKDKKQEGLLKKLVKLNQSAINERKNVVTLRKKAKAIDGTKKPAAKKKAEQRVLDAHDKWLKIRNERDALREQLGWASSKKGSKTTKSTTKPKKTTAPKKVTTGTKPKKPTKPKKVIKPKKPDTGKK